MFVFHLRVEADGDRWRVLAGPAHGRRLGGTVPRTEARVELPALLLPDDDLAVTRAELEAGRALGAVLAGAPALELGAALARASDRGEPLLIVVETPDPEVAALPWELLADPDGLPLEATGRAVIVRRAAGAAFRELPGTPATWAWCPEPEDPVSAELLAAIAVSAALPSSGPLVSFVVAHGSRASGLLALSARAAPGTVHTLSPTFARSALVVLAVCEAGDGDVNDAIGGVLAAGCGACLAPRGRLGVTAAATFVGALQQALDGGACVARAVAAGRRAVAALARPYPEDRWARMALYVADDRSADVVLASWAARARLVARRMGSGFTGLEHLALALVEGPPNPELASLRFALSARADGIRERIGRFFGGSSDAPLTPRLQALPNEPWPALAETAALAELAGPSPTAVTDEQTVTAWPADRGASGPARTLEVLLGPEDGRVLVLRPGQTLGRAARDARADQTLYEDRASDPRLSRAHLRWLGDGEVELLGPARLGDVRVEGLLRLHGGDRLALTPATVLLARG